MPSILLGLAAAASRSVVAVAASYSAMRALSPADGETVQLSHGTYSQFDGLFDVSTAVGGEVDDGGTRIVLTNGNIARRAGTWNTSTNAPVRLDWFESIVGNDAPLADADDVSTILKRVATDAQAGEYPGSAGDLYLRFLTASGINLWSDDLSTEFSALTGDIGITAPTAISLRRNKGTVTDRSGATWTNVDTNTWRTPTTDTIELVLAEDVNGSGGSGIVNWSYPRGLIADLENTGTKHSNLLSWVATGGYLYVRYEGGDPTGAFNIWTSDVRGDQLMLFTDVNSLTFDPDNNITLYGGLLKDADISQPTDTITQPYITEDWQLDSSNKDATVATTNGIITLKRTLTGIGKTALIGANTIDAINNSGISVDAASISVPRWDLFKVTGYHASNVTCWKNVDVQDFDGASFGIGTHVIGYRPDGTIDPTIARYNSNGVSGVGANVRAGGTTYYEGLCAHITWALRQGGSGDHVVHVFTDHGKLPSGVFQTGGVTKQDFQGDFSDTSYTFAEIYRTGTLTDIESYRVETTTEETHELHNLVSSGAQDSGFRYKITGLAYPDVVSMKLGGVVRGNLDKAIDAVSVDTANKWYYDGSTLYFDIRKRRSNDSVVEPVDIDTEPLLVTTSGPAISGPINLWLQDAATITQTVETDKLDYGLHVKLFRRTVGQRCQITGTVQQLLTNGYVSSGTYHTIWLRSRDATGTPTEGPLFTSVAQDNVIAGVSGDPVELSGLLQYSKGAFDNTTDYITFIDDGTAQPRRIITVEKGSDPVANPLTTVVSLTNVVLNHTQDWADLTGTTGLVDFSVNSVEHTFNNLGVYNFGGDIEKARVSFPTQSVDDDIAAVTFNNVGTPATFEADVEGGYQLSFTTAGKGYYLIGSAYTTGSGYQQVFVSAEVTVGTAANAFLVLWKQDNSTFALRTLSTGELRVTVSIAGGGNRNFDTTGAVFADGDRHKLYALYYPVTGKVMIFVDDVAQTLATNPTAIGDWSGTTRKIGINYDYFDVANSFVGVIHSVQWGIGEPPDVVKVPSANLLHTDGGGSVLTADDGITQLEAA